jgi:hypothetical protein
VSNPGCSWRSLLPIAGQALALRTSEDVVVRDDELLRDALGVMGNHQPPAVFFLEHL